MRAEGAMTTVRVRQDEDAESRSSAGTGRLEVRSVAGKSVVTRAAARSPLKILTPRTQQSSAAWIYAGTYGGGLVGGDSIDLDVHAHPKTTTLLSTQASTKVYRTSGLPCRQELHVTIEDDATFINLPDPLVCFADSNYEQHQRFNLSASANLVMVDWITSGRWARGERWAFERYQSVTEVFQSNRCIFRDAILLDPTDGPLDGLQRMGACDCFATIILAGPAMRAQVDAISKFVAAQPLDAESAIHFSASLIPGGVVCRAAATETELLGRWIHERLSFVSTLLGQDPWERKW